MPTALLLLGVGLALAQQSGEIVSDISDTKNLGVGGGWGKAFPADGGSWWLLASGEHEYRLFELDEDLVASPAIKGLTGEIHPCVDHAMSACDDGTYLHVCSGNVESYDDSAYYFVYDSDFEVLESGVITERDTDFRYNDAPVLCAGDLRGTVFHPYVEGWSPFVTLDGGVVLDDPPFEVNPVPPIAGNALILEPETGTVLRFASAWEENTLIVDRLEPWVDQPLERVEVEVLSPGYEVYWPQSVARVEDVYLVVHVAREAAAEFDVDFGNMYLAVLDLQLNLLEHHQLTFDEPEDGGGMRPFVAVQDDIALVVYESNANPHAVSVTLDIEAILTGNRAPIAVASGPPKAVVTEYVLLYGRDSWDPNDDPLTFSWEVLAAPEGSELAGENTPDSDSDVLLLRPDVVGTYTLALEVSDGVEVDVAEASIEILEEAVTGLSGFGAPVAMAESVQRAVVNQDVRLDGSLSWDPDGDEITAAWAVLVAPEGSRLRTDDLVGADRFVATFQPDVPGDYELLLVVDDGWLLGADSIVVSVLGEYLGCASSRRSHGSSVLVVLVLAGLVSRRRP